MAVELNGKNLTLNKTIHQYKQAITRHEREIQTLQNSIKRFQSECSHMYTVVLPRTFNGNEQTCLVCFKEL